MKQQNLLLSDFRLKNQFNQNQSEKNLKLANFLPFFKLKRYKEHELHSPLWNKQTLLFNTEDHYKQNRTKYIKHCLGS